jgi:hypothetical protein
LRQFGALGMVRKVAANEPEALISREELVATIFRINDIADDVKHIRTILEGDDEEEETE